MVMTSNVELQRPSASATGVAVDVLETLVNRAFDRAKRWAGAVVALQVTLFAAGVLAIFWPDFTLSYPWFALPLALIGTELSRRAGTFKSLAEAAKRQHEQVAGFGVRPSGGQLADLRQHLQNELSPAQSELLKQGITYASDEPYGARRTLENLSESAWFTKHLANRCALWIATTFICTVTIAVSLLLWSASSAADAPARFAFAKSVAGTLIFLISIGSVRAWSSYSKLSQKAKDIDSEACHLLRLSDPSVFDAQRLLTEYQVARATAPLIPTWMWKLHRTTLNTDWALKRPTNDN